MMNDHEVDEAVKELRASWYSPLSEPAERVWRRTLPGITKTEFKATLDECVSRGFGRPPPSEFYELARVKSGKSPAGGRVQHEGPFLDDPVAEEFPGGAELTPPATVPELVEKLRQRMKEQGVTA